MIAAAFIQMDSLRGPDTEPYIQTLTEQHD